MWLLFWWLIRLEVMMVNAFDWQASNFLHQVGFIERYISDSVALFIGNILAGVCMIIAPWAADFQWVAAFIFVANIGQGLVDLCKICDEFWNFRISEHILFIWNIFFNSEPLNHSTSRSIDRFSQIAIYLFSISGVTKGLISCNFSTCSLVSDLWLHRL